MREEIRAVCVLTAICAAVSAALVYANDLTKDKIAAAEEMRLQESLTTAFGAGQYTALDLQIEGIEQVIAGADGLTVFDIISTGYEKDGQHLLIGMDAAGAVCGISFVSITDSPTQAAKVQDAQFLSQFLGAAEPDFSYSAVSGATKSSGGVRDAVQRAVTAYQEHEEVLRNG